MAGKDLLGKKLLTKRKGGGGNKGRGTGTGESGGGKPKNQKPTTMGFWETNGESQGGVEANVG